MPYADPPDLWIHALPPDALFGEQGIEAGTFTDPTRTTGTGLGQVLCWERSHPRGTFAVRVQVASGGELNETGYLNPGPEPTFRVSLDGGVSYGVILRPDATKRINYVKGGVGLVLQNGTLGDPVTFGTGNASVIFTPRRAGCSVQIVSGTALSHVFKEGALILTVGAATTSAEAVAYLEDKADAAADYVAWAAGGNGSGVVQAAAKAALPFASFVTGDVWSFATTPSPDITAALRAASDKMDGYLRGTFRLPLTAWGDDLRAVCCVLARWALLIRKGLDQGADVDRYSPEKLGTMDWLRAVQTGNLTPTATETPPPVLFPLLVPPIDPLSPEAGSFPI